jgi:sortase A
MAREKIIYRAPRLPARYKPFLLKKCFLVLGNLFLLITFLGFIFTFGPLFIVRVRYQFKKEATQVTQKIGFGDLLKKGVTQNLITAPDPYFSLVIPKIDARAKVSANIDAGNAKEYLVALKKGVAHARGTVFPGMKGTIYLFAHSTDAPINIVRYNAVFFLLNELVPGDEIVVFFYGLRYNYQVTEKKIIEPTQTDFFGQKEEEMLVLQTCYPPGTTRKALLVIAKRS